MPTEYPIIGDLDKPFHRPECCCASCEQWRRNKAEAIREQTKQDQPMPHTYEFNNGSDRGEDPPGAGYAKMLKRLEELPPKPPATLLLMDEPGHSVELMLDTERSYYGEWIRGEGGDICLYRDRETDKVIGCCLPMYQKELRVTRIEKQCNTPKK